MADYVTVLPSEVERAARVAAAATAESVTTQAWDVQLVLNLALKRGLEVLEQRYLAASEDPRDWEPGPLFVLLAEFARFCGVPDPDRLAAAFVARQAPGPAVPDETPVSGPAAGPGLSR